MRTSCIIDNYNYGRFLKEAVESALNQSRPFDEIIVVDDGSTDESRKVLEDYKNFPKIQLVLKENGGQLSAFNKGFEASSGDVVCFLDSDDRYGSGFLEEILTVFETRKEVDHVFCDCRQIDGDGRYICDKHRYSYPKDILFGYTAAKTYFLHSWTGNATSMNAVSRRVLSKIFPLDMEDAFHICADRPLVMGSSLVGGKKYYLRKTLVDYRVHGSNLFYDNPESYKRYYMHDEIQTNLKMFRIIMKANQIEERDLRELIFLEYEAKPTKYLHETNIYLYMIWVNDLPFLKKAIASWGILKAYLKSKFSKSE